MQEKCLFHEMTEYTDQMTEVEEVMGASAGRYF